MRHYMLLLVLLWTLNVADALLTNVGLALGAVELNPLYSQQSLLGKLLAPAALAAAWVPAYIYCRQNRFMKLLTLLKAILYLLVALYIAVVANNIFQIIFWRRNELLHRGKPEF